MPLDRQGLPGITFIAYVVPSFWRHYTIEADGINTSVDIAGITLKNTVMPASGTFGSGQEYSEFLGLGTAA